MYDNQDAMLVNMPTVCILKKSNPFIDHYYSTVQSIHFSFKGQIDAIGIKATNTSQFNIDRIRGFTAYKFSYFCLYVGPLFAKIFVF